MTIKLVLVASLLTPAYPARVDPRPCPAITRNVKDSRFAPGQVWTYASRPGEEASTVTILEIDSSAKLGTLVHIRVDGLKMHNPHGEAVPAIEHMPFSRDAFLMSVRELKQSHATLPTLEGYVRWSSDCGGVYSISIADAVEITQQTFLSGHR